MTNTQAYKVSLAIAGLILGAFLLSAGHVSAAVYNPTINPADFSTTITNKYFSLPVGMKMEYQGKTDEGIETIEITIPGDTKTVMGVTTLVYRDRVWLDGELIEDTTDYLAQDKEGNVWYFGENVNNYENGKLKDHAGTWIAGVDGALPGIWMKANPKVGETYLQEYYIGEAEDEATVLSTNETVKVPYGTLTNCLKTLDVNSFTTPETDEHKYYCPEVKGFALEVEVATGARIELVKSSVESAAGNSNADAEKMTKLKMLISLLQQMLSLLMQQKGL